MSKYLGQHFLINKDKLREIVEALELKNGDTVIEIGPGHGELTEEIIEKLKDCKIERLILVEKDEKLAEFLKNKIKFQWNSYRNIIEIIQGDILKIFPKIISNQQSSISNYKIVGNIPYYITGYLLRILGELENKPLLIVLTVQKEVAERVYAEPPRMNLLAASVQFWAKPEITGYIPKKDFQPIPEVDSAIIKFTPLKNAFLWGNSFLIKNKEKEKGSKEKDNKEKKEREEKYYKFIKILFKQPRKTILNNLTTHYRGRPEISNLKNKEEIIKKLAEIDVNLNARPQDLSIEHIKKLAEMV